MVVNIVSFQGVTVWFWCKAGGLEYRLLNNRKRNTCAEVRSKLAIDILLSEIIASETVAIREVYKANPLSKAIIAK